MLDIGYTAWQGRPRSIIFAWYLLSLQLHLENIIHGIAWQIIYLLAYCSKLVSRWGFRFSILSQRKMNKECKTPKILIHHRLQACDLLQLFSLYTSPIHLLFCYKGEMWINATLMSVIPRCWAPSSSCAGHVFWPLLVSFTELWHWHLFTNPSFGFCLLFSSHPKSWSHLQSFLVLHSDRPKFPYFHDGLSILGR